MQIGKYCNAIKKYIFNCDYRFVINSSFGIYNNMSDEQYLQRKFKAYLERDLDLSNPVTLNEKLQWLKLYYRDNRLTTYVDKYLVRNYVSNTIGDEYLIPILGVWDKPDDIDFSLLPNQFVLKCNHNSGTGMCICKDKSKLDFNSVKKNLQKGLDENYYLIHREWPYKNVSRKIIAEKYMVNENEEGLRDYKFQCFNGKFDSVFVCVGRFSTDGVRYHYFDENWNYLPYSPYPDEDGKNLDYLKPKNFKKMIEISEILASDLPEVRIDLYEINGKIYFGEMTFFSQSGFDAEITYDADLKMGSKIQLPNKVLEIR